MNASIFYVVLNDILINTVVLHVSAYCTLGSDDQWPISDETSECEINYFGYVFFSHYICQLPPHLVKLTLWTFTKSVDTFVVHEGLPWWYLGRVMIVESYSIYLKISLNSDW